jgi:hypothetical protein
MKKINLILLSLLLNAGSLFAQQPWQSVTQPVYNYMLKSFAEPPNQYAQTLTYGLTGPLSPESISADLVAIYKQGIRVVSIEGGYRMSEPYLSDGYFQNVKIIVEELKKRNMYLWIIDEGKYPSGFAGGLISKKSPELRMQGILVSKQIRTESGQPLSVDLSESSISAIAVNDATWENKPVAINNGKLQWPATPGTWQITVVEHRFKTAVTRAANNPTGGKDTTNSLIDYLDPAATNKFIEYTHEQYKKHVGAEFGKTILGFRGDEPEYGFTPWSPKLLEIFRQKKKYDITPYLAAFFIQNPTAEQRLAKADFWDVWTDLFRDNFFRIQADWCSKNGLEYMVHINHEDEMMKLVRSGGDFFKAMRYVQVPGVDAIWHQIWYDNVADFPKLASSAAHMYGRPRSLSESFAAYRPAPTVADARWIVNQQLVRGINLFEYMFWSSGEAGRRSRSYLQDTAFIKLSHYSNRASWLLANGIPAAKVGVYCPTETMWLGDVMADSTMKVISRQLLQHQVDFDYVDNQGLASVFKLQNGSFTNLSGQKYTAIIFPLTAALTSDVVVRLKAFAEGGGKVYFMSDIPTRLVTNNFLNSTKMPDLRWAKKGDWNNIPASFFDELPRDVKLTKAAPDVKYLHRIWKNADMYFFFNEAKEAISVDVTVDGTGKATFWDAETGKVQLAPRAKKEGAKTTLPLNLGGYQTIFLVLQR